MSEPTYSGQTGDHGGWCIVAPNRTAIETAEQIIAERDRFRAALTAAEEARERQATYIGQLREAEMKADHVRQTAEAEAAQGKVAQTQLLECLAVTERALKAAEARAERLAQAVIAFQNEANFINQTPEQMVEAYKGNLAYWRDQDNITNYGECCASDYYAEAEAGLAMMELVVAALDRDRAPKSKEASSE